MDYPQLVGLLVVLGISFLSLIGLATLSLKQALLQRITFILISIAAGTLMGDVFLHILPELTELWVADVDWGVIVIGGIVFFFVLEKILHWHHHHHLDAQAEHDHDKEKGKTVGWINLAADALHNFIDGLILGAAFSLDLQLGLATAAAIALHELPQEIGDFGILIHAGFKRMQALRYNFFSALVAVVGYFVAVFVGGNFVYNNYLLAFAAGGFIYVAVADLLPQLHADKRWRVSLIQLAFVIIGVAIMWALTMIE